MDTVHLYMLNNQTIRFPLHAATKEMSHARMHAKILWTVSAIYGLYASHKLPVYSQLRSCTHAL